MLFNRYGSCVFFEEWNRTRKVNMVEMKTNMYGLVFEMKRFIIKTSPTGKTPEYFAYTTNVYKMHCFETASGKRFILVTDPSVGDLKEELRKIYSTIFVEYVIKNPLFKIRNSETSAFEESLKECELFTSELHKYLQSLPCWSSA